MADVDSGEEWRRLAWPTIELTVASLSKPLLDAVERTADQRSSEM
jgi:hypothetical protein